MKTEDYLAEKREAERQFDKQFNFPVGCYSFEEKWNYLKDKKSQLLKYFYLFRRSDNYSLKRELDHEQAERKYYAEHHKLYFRILSIAELFVN